MHYGPFILSILGFCVGTFGTLIGAGGGFILVPVLLILYPALAPETLTGISLAVVCANAISGSVAYAFKKRIDYRSAIIFSIAAAPGSILGAYAISLIPRENFELAFGIVMILIASFLLFEKKQTGEVTKLKTQHPVRVLTDKSGQQHHISYNSKLGVLISIVVGFVSSLLGIGGGIIHVPALVKILNFPVHIATATSHAILAVVALIGLTVHVFAGDLDSSVTQILWLVPSVIIGAQLGAYLSHRVNGPWIMRALAIGLLSVGIRFVIYH